MSISPFTWLLLLVLVPIDAGARSFVTHPTVTHPTAQRLRVTTSGMIHSPLVPAPQFATVPGHAGTSYLPNILLSPDEKFIAARGHDNAFHDLRIDPQTGKVHLRQPSGVFGESASPRAEGELSDYLQFMGMDGHPLVNRFLARHPRSIPVSAHHRGVAPTGDGSHDGGGVSLIGAHDRVDDFERHVPVSAPGNPSREIPVTGGTPRTPSRFSMFTAVDERVSEADGVRRVQAIGGGCGSVPVSRQSTGRNDATGAPLCSLAFYTAAHCFPTEADSNDGGDPKKAAFRYLIFGESQGRPLRVEKDQMEVHFGNGYTGRDRRVVQPDGSVKIQRVTSPDDFALVVFNAPCAYLAAEEVANLAGDSSETPGLVGVGRGERLSAQTQENTNAGGAVSGVSAERDQWQVQLDHLGAIDFGDSGGPVFNARGELVGSISRKIAETDDKPAYGFSFDPKGIPWARQFVASHSGRSVASRTVEGEEPPAPMGPDRRGPAPPPGPERPPVPPREPHAGPDGFDDVPQIKSTRLFYGGPPYPRPIDENGNPIGPEPEPEPGVGDEPPAPMPGGTGGGSPRPRDDEPPAPMPRGDVRPMPMPMPPHPGPGGAPERRMGDDDERGDDGDGD